MPSSRSQMWATAASLSKSTTLGLPVISPQSTTRCSCTSVIPSSLGSTSITLQFDLDRDPDAAGRDVQAAINAAAGDLPTNLPFRPNYRKVNPADTPIMIVALNSKTLPLPQIFDAADTVLAQKIAQVEGVGQVFVGGGQQPAVRIQVDPEAAAGVNLTLADVRQLLASTSVNRPTGSLGGELQSTTLATNDQLLRADQYRGLVLQQSAGGTVRLDDVARVEDSVQDIRVAGWTNQVRSVILVIRRQPGANIIETVERIKALLPRYPPRSRRRSTSRWPRTGPRPFAPR
jgi:multidrug efflux pump